MAPGRGETSAHLLGAPVAPGEDGGCRALEVRSLEMVVTVRMVSSAGTDGQPLTHGT